MTSIQTETRLLCPLGHTGRDGHKFCHECGDPLSEREFVAITCPTCNRIEFEDPTSSRHSCPLRPKKERRVRQCKRCGEIHWGTESASICPLCNSQSTSLTGKVSDLITQSTDRERLASKSVRVFRSLQILDGIGWAPELGSMAVLILSKRRLEIGRESFGHHDLRPIDFKDLQDLQIKGGHEEGDLGLIGGGFGVKGAAKGAAIATLINAATHYSNDWVDMTFADASGGVTLRFPGLKENEAIKMFRKAREAIHFRGSTPNNVEISSNVEELERLASLHERGLLSDTEFVTAKKRVLGL